MGQCVKKKAGKSDRLSLDSFWRTSGVTRPSASPGMTKKLWDTWKLAEIKKKTGRLNKLKAKDLNIPNISLCQNPRLNMF